jgi:mono/diheme cytochrome c family protein
MNALAGYYSKQRPFASPRAPFSHSTAAAAVEHAKSVYNEGDPAHGVPACAACHGPDASGSDQFPRLAGQYASYMLKQLRALHSGARVSVVMNGVAASRDVTVVRQAVPVVPQIVAPTHQVRANGWS